MNNRKILQGFYQGLGIEDVVGAIRIADKLDKSCHDGVIEGLTGELGLAQSVASKCVELASIQTEDASFADEVRAFGVDNELLEAGLEELTFVMLELAHLKPGTVVADMSIARGFDYYTGTVYEGKLVDYPDFPTVFAGGNRLVGLEILWSWNSQCQLTELAEYAENVVNRGHCKNQLLATILSP